MLYEHNSDDDDDELHTFEEYEASTEYDVVASGCNITKGKLL